MTTTMRISNTPVSTIDALWSLIQSQPKRVQQAIERKFKEREGEAERQKRYVKGTLTRSLRELELAKQGKVKLEDAKDLFKQP